MPQALRALTHHDVATHLGSSNLYGMLPPFDSIPGQGVPAASSLPRNHLFMLPKLPRFTIDIPQSQKYRCPSAFIDSLSTSTFRHVRNHKSGTAAVDQHLSPFRFVLMRDRSCHAGNATLTHSVGCTGPTFLFLLALFYGGCECFHQLCDILGSLGGGKGIADGV